MCLSSPSASGIPETMTDGGLSAMVSGVPGKDAHMSPLPVSLLLAAHGTPPYSAIFTARCEQCTVQGCTLCSALSAQACCTQALSMPCRVLHEFLWGVHYFLSSLRTAELLPMVTHKESCLSSENAAASGDPQGVLE